MLQDAMKLLYWTSLAYDYKEVSLQMLGCTKLQAVHPDCASKLCHAFCWHLNIPSVLD